MPYAVTPEMQAALDSGATTLAVFIRLERKDGLTLGFTSWPYPVAWTDGVTYRPDDGGLASEIANGAEGIDNLEAQGALTDERITLDDLEGRLWDEARVELFLASADKSHLGRIVRLVGTFGETTTNGRSWRAEFRGLSQRARIVVGAVTSAECRCTRLGDRRCGVNLDGNTLAGVPIRPTRTVHSVPEEDVIDFTDSAPHGHFAGGIVKMLTGPNAGIERSVRRHLRAGSRSRLELRLPGFPFPISPGETAVLTAGCDKKFSTCNLKYGNQLNFDGEHLLPGNGQVQRQGRGASG